MSVTLHGDIEAPKFVTCERVGPALKDDHRRLEHFHRTGNDLNYQLFPLTLLYLQTALLTGSYMLLKESSLRPSFSGTLIAYPFPFPRPRSSCVPVPGKYSPNLW